MSEVLTGDLAWVALPSVVQLVESEGLSGRLHLEGLGRMSFARGLPVEARCGEIDGQDAFLELFLVGQTLFRFERAPIEATEPIGDVLGLIIEGCRLADEWQRLRGMVLGLERPADQPSSPLGRLLAQLDGTTVLEDALTRAKVSRVAVIDGLLDLLQDGLVQQRTRAPVPVREVRPSTDYYQAIENGRAQMRAGDLVGATKSFELALAQRPGDRIARQNLKRAKQIQEGGAPSSPFRSLRREVS